MKEEKTLHKTNKKGRLLSIRSSLSYSEVHGSLIKQTESLVLDR